MIAKHEPVTPEQARQAAARIEPVITRTPLTRLEVDAPCEIWLKLENLQPIRSFKIRGGANLMLSQEPGALDAGVWTASAGNMAQGVAWCARSLGIECTVVVPEGAPETKIEAVRRLGGRVVRVGFEDWFRIYETRQYDGVDGLFVHAFSDHRVMAGNATIALEILEDLPDVDTVLIPYGGGGLSCGIAAVINALHPETRCWAVEPESAAPLHAAFQAGHPVDIEYGRSFVDGAGGPRLFPEMWDLANLLLQGPLAVPLDATADAVRLLARSSAVVAEGAGALPVAAARAGVAGGGKVVCIVSGGNIDADLLAEILGPGRAIPGLPPPAVP